MAGGLPIANVEFRKVYRFLECVATPSAVLKMRRKFFLQLAGELDILLSLSHLSLA